MLPGLIAAPFSVVASVLSDTNTTDVVRVFNESNVSASSSSVDPFARLMARVDHFPGQYHVRADDIPLRELSEGAEGLQQQLQQLVDQCHGKQPYSYGPWPSHLLR